MIEKKHLCDKCGCEVEYVPDDRRYVIGVAQDTTYKTITLCEKCYGIVENSLNVIFSDSHPDSPIHKAYDELLIDDILNEYRSYEHTITVSTIEKMCDALKDAALNGVIVKKYVDYKTFDIHMSWEMPLRCGIDYTITSNPTAVYPKRCIAKIFAKPDKIEVIDSRTKKVVKAMHNAWRIPIL